MSDQPDQPQPPEQDPTGDESAQPGGYGQPASGGYGQPASGGYGQPAGFGEPAGAEPGYGAPVSDSTNKFAIGSLVASVAGLLCGIGAIVGIVLGVVALKQINERGERGRNLAIGGIAVGAVVVALGIIIQISSAT